MQASVSDSPRQRPLIFYEDNDDCMLEAVPSTRGNLKKKKSNPSFEDVMSRTNLIRLNLTQQMYHLFQVFTFHILIHFQYQQKAPQFLRTLHCHFVYLFRIPLLYCHTIFVNNIVLYKN